MAGLGLELKLKPPHTLKNCFVVRFEAAKSLASKSTPLLEEICQKKDPRGKNQKKSKRPGSSQARGNLAKQRTHACQPILPGAF
jgi:hypothetical protein